MQIVLNRVPATQLSANGQLVDPYNLAFSAFMGSLHITAPAQIPDWLISSVSLPIRTRRASGLVSGILCSRFLCVKYLTDTIKGKEGSKQASMQATMQARKEGKEMEGGREKVKNGRGGERKEKKEGIEKELGIFYDFVFHTF